MSMTTYLSIVFADDFGHATPFGNRVIAENVAQELLKLTELNE